MPQLGDTFQDDPMDPRVAPAPLPPVQVPDPIREAALEAEYQRMTNPDAGSSLYYDKPPITPPANVNPNAGFMQPSANAALAAQQAGPYVPPAPPVLRASPVKATEAYLGTNADRQALEANKGEAESQGLAQIAKLQNDAALEARLNAQDYQAGLFESKNRFDKSNQQLQDAYNDYRKQAGNLKNPSEQFWADKGTDAHIASGLAGFASGFLTSFGAALQGKQDPGNPWLQFLNKQIEDNYNAHRQNIQDLYNEQVAAGKIDDNAHNRAMWDQQARVQGYQLSAMHLVPELESIKANTNSNTVKILAQQGIDDLKDRSTALQENLFHTEAAQKAAVLAQQRADQKTAREAYEKSLERNKEILDPTARADAAFHEVAGLPGISNASKDALAASLGIERDPKTGQYSHAVPTEGGTLDYGTTKSNELKVQVPDGKGGFTVKMGNSKEDADDARAMIAATNDLEKGTNRLREIENQLATLQSQPHGADPEESIKRERLVGEYQTIAKDMVVRYNTAVSGVKRATGQGEAHVLSEDAIPSPPNFYFNLDPVTGRNMGNEGKFKALDQIIEGNRKSIAGYLKPEKEQPKPNTTNKPSVAPNKPRFTPKQ